MRRFITLSILMLIVCKFSFAEEKIYYCRRLAREPVLDGRIKDDLAWENITEASGFVKLGKTALTPKQTSFRLGYCSDALYIGIRCEDPEIGKSQAKCKDDDKVKNRIINVQKKEILANLKSIAVFRKGVSRKAKQYPSLQKEIDSFLKNYAKIESGLSQMDTINKARLLVKESKKLLKEADKLNGRILVEDLF